MPVVAPSVVTLITTFGVTRGKALHSFEQLRSPRCVALCKIFFSRFAARWKINGELQRIMVRVVDATVALRLRVRGDATVELCGHSRDPGGL